VGFRRPNPTGTLGGYGCRPVRWCQAGRLFYGCAVMLVPGMIPTLASEGADARPGRSRSSRVQATNDRLMDATCDVIFESGWDCLALTSVAQKAGVTTRPLYDRFPDKTDLAIACWRTRASGPLRDSLIRLLDIAVDYPAVAADPARLLGAYEAFTTPTSRILVAAELLCAAVFSDRLRAVIAEDFGQWVRGWCIPSKGVTATRAAQSAYVLASGIGLVLGSRRTGMERVDVSGPAMDLVAAISQPSRPARLPKWDADHMAVPEVDLADPAFDRLLAATLWVVSQVGYAEATLPRIVSAAGVSQGLLYGRFASKLEAFIAATDHRHEGGLLRNAEESARLARQYGPGVADAVMWREFTRAESRSGRALGVEQVRVGWRELELRARTDAAEAIFANELMKAGGITDREAGLAEIHWDLALGFGAYLLPEVLPGIAQLPFDVVTVPLLGGKDRLGIRPAWLQGL